MAVKVALIQSYIVWEEKEKNYEKANLFIKEAASQNVDLLLFPEMSFTGFSMNTDLTKESLHETVSFVQRISAKNSISIGFGWVKDCNEKSENVYTIVNKEGRIISEYSKIHPFSYSGEDKKFQGGTSLVEFELNNIWFSNFICYDLRFPEIFQAVSGKVDVIVVPANWPKSRRKHWLCLLQARAIENQVYILAVNCVGNINGIEYSGDSCIINPNGEIIDILTDKEGMIIYDLNNDVEEYRSSFPVKKDRKEELYKKIKIL